MSCGVGRLDPELLWLWRRLASTAPIGPLAWAPPYAMGVALKRQKKKKKVALWGWESHFSSRCSVPSLISAPLLQALNPPAPPLQATPSSTASDTRKHFQAFLVHTSHPLAGWETRCQQSTTHPAGKEPDGMANEQQAAHQPFTTMRFP